MPYIYIYISAMTYRRDVYFNVLFAIYDRSEILSYDMNNGEVISSAVLIRKRFETSIYRVNNNWVKFHLKYFRAKAIVVQKAARHS